MLTWLLCRRLDRHAWTPWTIEDAALTSGILYARCCRRCGEKRQDFVRFGSGRGRPR